MRWQLALLIVVLLNLGVFAALPAPEPVITVYKTATCGCCGFWVKHLQQSGFQVVVKEVSSTDEYQKRYGVPEELRSCHTAIVDGYTIEGHVPAAEIQRMLKEKPKAKGISVPGMPVGSPGMEAGDKRDRFEVLLFRENGQTALYKEYPAR